MLILTRRVGETIMMTVPPSDKEQLIMVTVLGVKGNQVRSGTDAPKEVIVDREEIYKRKQLEKAADNAKRQL